MIKFIGEYSAKVDDKGRVVFPADFKALMNDTRLVVRKNLYEPCLEIFTYAEWERQSEEIKARLDFFKPEHERFWREYMRSRALVCPDGKLGRINIPDKLLQSIGVQKEVVFLGADHKIELWARESFEASALGEDEMAALAQTLSK
ncbi:MAG: hypothetical protein J6Y32_01460 [Bacteroidales bacterium]|nr:hypothetical protein [Bacteroidales bacterium]